MKISKRFLLASVCMLATFVSFAEDPYKHTSSYSNRFNVGRLRSIGADSGTPDFKHLEFGVRYMPTFSSIDVNTYSTLR